MTENETKFAEINNKYANTCAQLGETAYNVNVLEARMGEFRTQLHNLAVDAAKIQKEIQKEKMAVAPDATTTTDSGAV